jgi:hypothetical protein
VCASNTPVEYGATNIGRGKQRDENSATNTARREQRVEYSGSRTVRTQGVDDGRRERRRFRASFRNAGIDAPLLA